MDAYDPRAWLDVAAAFVQFHLPRVTPSTDLLLPAAVAVTLGLLMVFRSAGMARLIVAFVGAIGGAWVGYAAGTYFAVSLPVCIAAGMAVLGGLAYRSWRLWIMLATIGVAVTLATALQLDTKSLREILIPPAGPAAVESPLPSSDQLRAIGANLQQQISDLWQRARAHCEPLGARGAILPVIASIVALLAAWWAGRVVAVLVMGLLGTLLTTTGALVGICVEWPDLRDRLTADPQNVIYFAGGLWLLGLFMQARRALLNRRKPAPAPAE